MNFDGNSGMNWEDFVTINNGDDDDTEDQGDSNNY